MVISAVQWVVVLLQARVCQARTAVRDCVSTSVKPLQAFQPGRSTFVSVTHFSLMTWLFKPVKSRNFNFDNEKVSINLCHTNQFYSVVGKRMRII